jgi:hypothetical protein
LPSTPTAPPRITLSGSTAWALLIKRVSILIDTDEEIAAFITKLVGAGKEADKAYRSDVAAKGAFGSGSTEKPETRMR